MGALERPPIRPAGRRAGDRHRPRHRQRRPACRGHAQRRAPAVGPPRPRVPPPAHTRPRDGPGRLGRVLERRQLDRHERGERRAATCRASERTSDRTAAPRAAGAQLRRSGRAARHCGRWLAGGDSRPQWSRRGLGPRWAPAAGPGARSRARIRPAGDDAGRVDPHRGWRGGLRGRRRGRAPRLAGGGRRCHGAWNRSLGLGGGHGRG